MPDRQGQRKIDDVLSFALKGDSIFPAPSLSLLRFPLKLFNFCLRNRCILFSVLVGKNDSGGTAYAVLMPDCHEHSARNTITEYHF